MAQEHSTRKPVFLSCKPMVFKGKKKDFCPN